MGIMKEICIRVLRWTLELIDVLVKKEIFKTRSEFVRFAIRFALYRYEAVLEDVCKHSRPVDSPKHPQKEEKDNQHFGLRGDVTYFCFRPAFC